MVLYFRLLTADFASAAVLISFGVVLGKASPFQLIIMALIEIVLFVANEVLGRAVFGVRHCVTDMISQNKLYGWKVFFIFHIKTFYQHQNDRCHLLTEDK